MAPELTLFVTDPRRLACAFAVVFAIGRGTPFDGR